MRLKREGRKRNRWVNSWGDNRHQLSCKSHSIYRDCTELKTILINNMWCMNQPADHIREIKCQHVQQLVKKIKRNEDLNAVFMSALFMKWFSIVCILQARHIVSCWRSNVLTRIRLSDTLESVLHPRTQLTALITLTVMKRNESSLSQKQTFSHHVFAEYLLQLLFLPHPPGLLLLANQHAGIKREDHQSEEGKKNMKRWGAPKATRCLLCQERKS